MLRNEKVDEIAIQQGWDDRSLTILMMEFIAANGLTDKFVEHCYEVAEEENADSEDDFDEEDEEEKEEEEVD